MAYSQRGRRYDDYSSSPPRYRSFSRSLSPRHYSDNDSADNPGTNLYITGLSTRVSERDLEDHFSTEGKVRECHLVVDPRTKESRGFGFVTMDSLKSAERCLKYLNRSILEGRVITVEKAKRKRARTPTPGRYLGIRTAVGRSLHEYDSRHRYRDGRRSPTYSPYRSERDYSPEYSPRRGRSRYKDRSLSPRYSYKGGSRYRDRSPSPKYSPPLRGGSKYKERSLSPSPRYSSRYSPHRGGSRYRYRSPSPGYSPDRSPPRESPYRSYRSRSRSRSISPRRSYRSESR